MLKYFKRQKSQRSAEPNENDVAASIEKRHSLLSTSSFCDEFLGEEDAQSLQSYSGASIETSVGDEDIFTYYSRLSMSLTSILRDTECMTCFAQYLDVKNALQIVKFYLDTENFKISALEQLRKGEQNACTSNGFGSLKHEIFNNNNNNNNDNDNKNETGMEMENACLEEEEQKGFGEAANNVPELKTLCDLSMHKPLTDDEKSQIYAETNKQITKCSGGITVTHKLKAYSEHSLNSEMSLDGGTASGDDTHNSHVLCISAASIKDAIAIYQKYLSPNAQFFVELPVNVLSDISLLLCKPQDDGLLLPISPNCFDEAQQFVLSELERLYLNDFLQSPFYCKYCLDLIIEEKLTINDILYSEVTLFFFMEFLEQQGERECLDFWTAAINFRKSYAGQNNELTSTDSKEIQEDAMIIYKKFFSLQSEERLWLSDKLRCRVEACICAPPEQIANCFDLALIVTAKYLEKKYFTAFLKSDIFTQYVNELKMKIHDQFYDIDNDNDIVDGNLPASSLQHKSSLKGSRKLAKTPSLKRRNHRKTLSDCTNDISCSGERFKHISQHNTLLAMDTSAMHLKNLQTSGTSLSIDARQLNNPNLLWQRRYSSNDGGTDNGGLKFGHVNSLGRYERDFETIESFSNHCGNKHHWSLGVSGSKIKNAMRKLVNLPEHKAQEEIAWQIAEMIVNDVTSVTLKNTPMANGVSGKSTAAIEGSTET